VTLRRWNDSQAAALGDPIAGLILSDLARGRIISRPGIGSTQQVRVRSLRNERLHVPDVSFKVKRAPA
jgi:hypothetical protein